MGMAINASSLAIHPEARSASCRWEHREHRQIDQYDKN
jgi:hypothetical protein